MFLTIFLLPIPQHTLCRGTALLGVHYAECAGTLLPVLVTPPDIKIRCGITLGLTSNHFFVLYPGEMSLLSTSAFPPAFIPQHSNGNSVPPGRACICSVGHL